MPALSTTRTYDNGEILLQTDTDAFIDDIESIINTTKLDADNIQDSGITASSKFIDATITETKLGASCVETVNINDDAVTDDKLAADCAGDGLTQDGNGALAVNVDDSTVELNTDTLRVKDSGITASKIADNAITTAKIADNSISRLKFTGNLSTGTGINASCSLTTNGGKVLVSVVNAARSGSGTITITRDGSTIETFYGADSVTSAVSGSYIDSPSAGTYTYAVVSARSSTRIMVMEI
jgi:hypothetical protein